MKVDEETEADWSDKEIESNFFGGDVSELKDLPICLRDQDDDDVIGSSNGSCDDQRDISEELFPPGTRYVES